MNFLEYLVFQFTKLAKLSPQLVPLFLSLAILIAMLVLMTR